MKNAAFIFGRHESTAECSRHIITVAEVLHHGIWFLCNLIVNHEQITKQKHR